jgi:hypothetical protein
MKIDNIDKMESIVKSNPDMEWDNWTVVVYTDDDGYFTKNGVFRNNRWQTKYTFNMVEYGVWIIPDRYLTHVQV